MKHVNRLNQIINEGIEEIQSLIQLSSEVSIHSNTQCLKITNDDLMFNLDGDRYLTEVTSTELIDDNGNAYGYTVLYPNDLCELFDYLISKYKK